MEFKIAAILSAFDRISEIQQRINDIQKKFGVKENFSAGTTNTNFQTELEQAMAKIKPIEQFLAENKVKPVNENAAANSEKVALALSESEGNNSSTSARLSSDTENFGKFNPYRKNFSI